MLKFKIIFSKWQEPNGFKSTIIRAEDQFQAMEKFFELYNIDNTYVFEIFQQV